MAAAILLPPRNRATGQAAGRLRSVHTRTPQRARARYTRHGRAKRRGSAHALAAGVGLLVAGCPVAPGCRCGEAPDCILTARRRHQRRGSHNSKRRAKRLHGSGTLRVGNETLGNRRTNEAGDDGQGLGQPFPAQACCQAPNVEYGFTRQKVAGQGHGWRHLPCKVRSFGWNRERASAMFVAPGAGSAGGRVRSVSGPLQNR